MNERAIIMGERIQSRRKELKIKQSVLAEYAVISINHMSGIENGTQNPSLDVFLRICEYLKTTPDHFLLGCMRTNNVPLDITDSLRLCNKEELQTISILIESFIRRKKL